MTIKTTYNRKRRVITDHHLSCIRESSTKNRAEIPEMVRFLTVRQRYELDLFSNKKNKASPESAARLLPLLYDALASLDSWTRQAVHDTVMALAAEQGLKTGQVMWPLRIALSGQAITPGGAIEIAVVLGRDESLARLRIALDRLSDIIAEKGEA